MRRIIMTLAMAITISLSLNPVTVFAQDANGEKAVLITGATTGIGRLTAEYLAANGYFVYAGARKASDIEELNEIDNVMAVRLDVTVQEEIDAAVKMIESEGRGLWGIVNNAGVSIHDPLIEAEISDLNFLFDVNVYGVFRISKAFAPMVIESQGRIVNISSIGGILSGGIHGMGMYVMSKHAIEAYTDQMAWELADLGVKVIAIEPGNYRSDIGMSRCKRMISQSRNREYKYFKNYAQDLLDDCKQYVAANTDSTAPPPTAVAEAIQHALFDDSPKEHYLVVSNQFEAMITIGKAMEELLHLNHNQEFSYTREQLIALMDEEWAILRGEKSRDWGEED
jgi:NAD(P)-dependent dehydrogenase (short-subunit alcohol dehydrogenase family)